LTQPWRLIYLDIPGDFERLFGQVVRSGSSYSVKRSRGVKIAFVLAKKEPARGQQGRERPPHRTENVPGVTIFRNDESSKTFYGKDARILVVDGSPKGKERNIAKDALDFSECAGVPSTSATKIIQI
jgi:hypothetical protein